LICAQVAGGERVNERGERRREREKERKREGEGGSAMINAYRD